MKFITRTFEVTKVDYTCLLPNQEDNYEKVNLSSEYLGEIDLESAKQMLAAEGKFVVSVNNVETKKVKYSMPVDDFIRLAEKEVEEF